jgi:hypothetical protein
MCERTFRSNGIIAQCRSQMPLPRPERAHPLIEHRFALARFAFATSRAASRRALV